MSDRPTPETDAARHDLSDYGSPVLCSWGDWVEADFARKLERERDEARVERDILRSNKMSDPLLETTFKHLIRERDEVNEELHKQLVRYDQLFDEAEKIRIERDEARGALERISHASMDARHKEEDYAEWEKAVFVLLDICEERKVK